MRKIRTMVVSDDRLYGSNIVAALASDDTIQVRGECVSNGQALDEARRVKPELVLLVRPPEKPETLQMVQALRSEAQAKVVVLGVMPLWSRGDAEFVLALMGAGIRSVIGHDTDIRDLPAALVDVAAGDTVFPDVVQSLFVQSLREARSNRAPVTR